MTSKSDRLTTTGARIQFRERLLFTLGLRSKPLKFFCEHCGKFIPSDMTWICGYCNTNNTRTNRFSFLNKCERCKSAPKSFHCPHCDGVMYFGKVRKDQHPARHTMPPVRSPIVPPTEEQVRTKKMQEREDRKSELQYHIACAKWDKELAELERDRTMLRKTPQEALEDDFSQHDTRFMAVHKIAAEKLKAYQQQYADDSELLEMATLSVQKWREKYI